MKNNEGLIDSPQNEERHETEVNADTEKLNFFRSSTVQARKI